MSFYSQYELLELVPGGTVRTFKARQIGSGRDVLVHLLVSGGEALERQLENLIPEKRAQILDRGMHEGTPYVVSTALPAGVNFEEWLSGPLKDLGTRAGKWDITQMRAALAGSAAPPPPAPK